VSADLRERVARALASVKRRRGFLATEIHLVDDLTRACDALLAELGPELQPQSEVERALQYLDRYLSAGLAAPDWAIHLASILTGGDGAAAPQPQARPHVNLSGLVAQAFATECWRAQPHASDYEIADAILEKLAPYLATPQPQAGAQASAEDLTLVGETLASLGASRAELAVEAAWQRIRASLGVGK
jgi:hypothetical protein